MEVVTSNVEVQEALGFGGVKGGVQSVERPVLLNVFFAVTLRHYTLIESARNFQSGSSLFVLILPFGSTKTMIKYLLTLTSRSSCEISTVIKISA